MFRFSRDAPRIFPNVVQLRRNIVYFVVFLLESTVCRGTNDAVVVASERPLSNNELTHNFCTILSDCATA